MSHIYIIYQQAWPKTGIDIDSDWLDDYCLIYPNFSYYLNIGVMTMLQTWHEHVAGLHIYYS